MSLEQALTHLVLNYGLIGLLLASIIANATLFLVVPIDLLIFLIAPISKEFFNPLIISIVAGLGAAIGELTSYILGLGGRKAIEKKFSKRLEHLNELKKRIKHSGMLFIFLGALTPFPFDLIGIVAGLIHYDLKKFFIASFAGKTTRYTIIAFTSIIGTEIALKFFGIN
jgi:membrane protein YqaA with SNARE-associated domain